MSMVQLAVAWVLENPIVTAPIIGASRPEQLDDALAAVDKGLDGSLKAAWTSSRASTAGRRHPLILPGAAPDSERMPGSLRGGPRQRRKAGGV